MIFLEFAVDINSKCLEDEKDNYEKENHNKN